MRLADIIYCLFAKFANLSHFSKNNYSCCDAWQDHGILQVGCQYSQTFFRNSLAMRRLVYRLIKPVCPTLICGCVCKGGAGRSLVGWPGDSVSSKYCEPQHSLSSAALSSWTTFTRRYRTSAEAGLRLGKARREGGGRACLVLLAGEGGS